MRRATSSAKTPSAGLPIASDFAIVSGPHRTADLVPGLERLRDRAAALGLGAVEGGSEPSTMPRSSHSSKPRAILVNSEPGCDRADDPVRQLEAELLGNLERERLGALGVVGAQVHVHERPRVLAESSVQSRLTSS